jgi:hypothetical protein
MTQKKRFVFLFLIVLFISASGLGAQTQPDPDTDGDGLNDSADDCDTVPGPRENNGCPYDNDGDGLPDSQDRCPNQAGPQSNNGCPQEADSDGDGLRDSADSCPNEFGPHDNGGCPLPPDTDDDGIVDDQDRCPTLAGFPGTNGCPLPIIPESGRCAVATSGDLVVNVRNMPSTEIGVIIGSLNPLNIYPVNLELVTEEGSWYHVIREGWVAGWVVRVGGDCEMLPAVQTPTELPAVQTPTGLLTVGNFSFDFSTTSTPPPDVTFGEDNAPAAECDEGQQAAFGCEGSVHVLDGFGGLVLFGDGFGDSQPSPLSPGLQGLISQFLQSPGVGNADSFFDVFFDIIIRGDFIADDGEHGDGQVSPIVIFMPPDPLGADNPGDANMYGLGIVIIELPGGSEGILLIKSMPGGTGLLGIGIVGFDGVDGESLTGMLFLGGTSLDGVDGESTDPVPPWIDVGLPAQPQGAIIVTPGSWDGFNPQPGQAMGILLLIPSSLQGFTPQPEPPGLGIFSEMMGLFTTGHSSFDGVDGEARDPVFIGGVLGADGTLQGLNINIHQGGSTFNGAEIGVSQ